MKHPSLFFKSTLLLLCVVSLNNIVAMESETETSSKSTEAECSSASSLSSSSEDLNDIESTRTAAHIRSEVEQAIKTRRKRAIYTAALVVTAGLICDGLTTWMAPATGNTAYEYNASGIEGCTMTRESNCNLVTNYQRCRDICAENKPFMDSTNPFGSHECYSMESCPNDAQARIIQGWISLGTRCVTAIALTIIRCNH
jgi:hypothetical protein